MIYAHKGKKKNLTHITIEMDLEDNVLCEISQSLKEKQCIVPLIKVSKIVKLRVVVIRT